MPSPGRRGDKTAIYESRFRPRPGCKSGLWESPFCSEWGRKNGVLKTRRRSKADDRIGVREPRSRSWRGGETPLLIDRGCGRRGWRGAKALTLASRGARLLWCGSRGHTHRAYPNRAGLGWVEGQARSLSPVQGVDTPCQSAEAAPLPHTSPLQRISAHFVLFLAFCLSYPVRHLRILNSIRLRYDRASFRGARRTWRGKAPTNK